MLTIAHVSKSFGRTRAVDDVSLEMQRGEIVGLVGENGAGKTTLMRIVAGELQAERGSIEGPREIGFVHQHFMLVNEFSIAENLALSTGVRDVSRIVAESGIELRDIDRRAGDLSVGEKSKVELIKAIAQRPKVLILDEPTSVLAPSESAELFAVMRKLAAAGTIVVFISHKIPEVLEVATRTIVMRAGRVVAENLSTPEDLARAMIGARRRPAGWPGAVPAPPTATPTILGDDGNGQNELAEALRAEHPRDHLAAIPEDRTRDGLVAEMSIAENIALAHRRWNRREAVARASRLIDLYDIRAQSPRQRAGSLSGGNQQKVILARELDRNPAVVVASEPTRGLDIESTRFVHDRLRAAAARGAKVIVITSDLDEAFALGDVIQVIYRGRLSERLTPAEAAEQAPRLMAGLQS